MVPLTVTPAGPGSKPGLPAGTLVTLASQCCGLPVTASLPEELFLLEPLLLEADDNLLTAVLELAKKKQCLSYLDLKDVFNTFFSSLSIESHVSAQW